MSCTSKFDDEPKNHTKIEAPGSFQSGNLSTSRMKTSSLHLPTFNGLHNSGVLTKNGPKWEEWLFNREPVWTLEPPENAVADVGAIYRRFSTIGEKSSEEIRNLYDFEFKH